jgi:argininosuccinate synthase
MHTTRIIDRLEDVTPELGTMVVLYSGGLDGSYFLQWAAEQGIRCVALTIGLDGHGVEGSDQAKTLAEHWGHTSVVQDRTEEFVNDFVRPGILANALYHGLYPVCSTLSRPLMARAAVDAAHQHGAGAVVHTATPMQNTAARLALSFMALDPSLTIVAPFLRSRMTREQKMEKMTGLGVTWEHGIYSIDQNVWGRVIENDTLEDCENVLPDAGVFTWTRDPDKTPDEPADVEIDFEQGVPVALNGEKLDLLSMILRLNEVGGRHGVGRTSGLEDITFGAKNHEIREAPAAHILVTAHRELESAVLTEQELTLKRFVDEQWTNNAVSGGWYSDLNAALFAFIARMNEVLDGSIRLRLHKGNVYVTRKRAAAGLYYPAFWKEFEDLVDRVDYPSTYQILGLPSLRRRPGL